jgi:hypothetical protein
MNLATVNQYGGLRYNMKNVEAWGLSIAPFDVDETWKLRIRREDGTNLQEDPVRKVIEVEDVWLALGYNWDTA